MVGERSNGAPDAATLNRHGKASLTSCPQPQLQLAGCRRRLAKLEVLTRLKYVDVRETKVTKEAAENSARKTPI